MASLRFPFLLDLYYKPRWFEMKIEGYIFGDWALCSGIHKEAGACKAFIL